MVRPLRQQKRVLLAMGRDYIDRLHHGVAEYAGKKDWHLTNLFGEDTQLIEHRKFDGVLTVLREQNDLLSEAVSQLKKPTVNLSITHDELEIPHLTGDNVDMGRAAANHFIDHGFRRFLWFSENNYKAAQLRLEGFRSELKAHGYDCHDLILDEVFPKGKPTWGHLTRRILQAIDLFSGPCAVYAYNDVQAVNFLDACVAGGIRIPDDIAVLGTDNHPLVCPTAAIPLSSINHDLEEMGRRAAKELELLMDGAPSKRKTILIPHKGITTRQSTDVFAINDAHVVRALRYMQENFSHDISVIDVTEASGTSRRSLERRFLEHLEIPISVKLSQLRVKNVCRMLRQTTLDIADIASLSGFNTPEYLHRVFLKQIGTTPRKYRMNAD